MLILKNFFTACSRISDILWNKSDKKIPKKNLRTILSIDENFSLSPRLMSHLEIMLRRIEKNPEGEYLPAKTSSLFI